MHILDVIQARADAATKRLAAWDERPDRVSFREFSAVDNGAIRVRTLHLSCESALLASAENANETIPKLIAALRAVEAVHVPGRVYEDEDSCGHAADHHDTIEAEGGEWVCLDTPLDEQVCTECRDSLGDPQPWPCPTITAINKELEGAHSKWMN